MKEKIRVWYSGPTAILALRNASKAHLYTIHRGLKEYILSKGVIFCRHRLHIGNIHRFIGAGLSDFMVEQPQEMINKR